MAALHRFQLAKIDISGAYLQAKGIERDIYVRPPTSWMTFPGERWKLLKPAYGLVDSGRLWQIDVESWMTSSYSLEQIPGFAQLFVLKSTDAVPILFVAKLLTTFLSLADLKIYIDFTMLCLQGTKLDCLSHIPLSFQPSPY